MKSSEILRDTRNIAAIGMTAALYTVLTTALAPFSFGMIQCRISEMLCLLAFINPVYGIGVTLGCFISNLASPYGALDMVVGTFATGLSVILVAKSKRLFIATLWPTVCCLLIGALIAYAAPDTPFWLAAVTVMIGEFIVVTLIGYPVFRYIMKNEKLMNMLKIK